MIAPVIATPGVCECRHRLDQHARKVTGELVCIAYITMGRQPVALGSIGTTVTGLLKASGLCSCMGFTLTHTAVAA